MIYHFYGFTSYLKIGQRGTGLFIDSHAQQGILSVNRGRVEHHCGGEEVDLGEHMDPGVGSFERLHMGQGSIIFRSYFVSFK